jgi:hypothetical protein
MKPHSSEYRKLLLPKLLTTCSFSVLFLTLGSLLSRLLSNIHTNRLAIIVVLGLDDLLSLAGDVSVFVLMVVAVDLSVSL